MEGLKIKQKLIEIFGEQLEFNKDSIKYTKRLKEGMIKDMINWCVRCKDHTEIGSVPKKIQKHLCFLQENSQ